MELYDVRRTRFVQAHASALACLALSQDGRALATASQRGTLVRIHSTADGSKLQVGAPPAQPARQSDIPPSMPSTRLRSHVRGLLTALQRHKERLGAPASLTKLGVP